MCRRARVLPAELRSGYEALRDTLRALQQTAASAPDGSPDVATLQTQFKQAQTQFQQDLLGRAMELSLPATVQSAQTEINRLLRLLGTDLTFLRSAKQAETQAKRLQQVRDRLTRLLEFCDGLLTDD